MQIQQIIDIRRAFLLFVFVFYSPQLFSQTSPNYHIKASTISSGAVPQQLATNFQASSSVGQCTSSPQLKGTQYFMQSGFNGIVKGLQMVVSVSVPQAETVPTIYRLHQNYPNPFNPTTTIQFELPKRSKVTLKIFNVLGTEVTTLVDKELKAGEYKVVFDAHGFPSGVFFYRILAEGFVQTKKLLLLK
ncbi:MAG: T9SS type A sorting domain-containing protein [bacterium]